MDGPTSRSHEMMEELRRLWFVLVGNNIHIMPRYIKSAANTWANKLNRHYDYDNWQLCPIVFHEMDT
jgi:hypothetical protein